MIVRVAQALELDVKISLQVRAKFLFRNTHCQGDWSALPVFCIAISRIIEWRQRPFDVPLSAPLIQPEAHDFACRAGCLA